jgi:uncharacterized protein YbjT (DUF2867 family)
VLLTLVRWQVWSCLCRRKGSCDKIIASIELFFGGTLMYVITGATGNTGRVVAEQLLAAGKKVRAVGRNTEKLRALAAQGAEPFVADIADAASLTRAFAGCEGAYLMIPPNPSSPDPLAYRKQVSDALIAALAKTQVKRAVTLSSVGADKTEGTGPVVGLHELEEKLNRVAGLNVLHLRPGYFMENTLAQVGIIQAIGTTAGPLRPDLKVPMIATHDIGAAAADALLRADYSGHQARELLGQRDLTMIEVAVIVGKAIGKVDLGYVQLPDPQVRESLVQIGMSEQVAQLLLEMAGAMNAGHMRPLEPRTAANSTPTSYESFVSKEWLPAYRAKTKAA